jgi:hypothetical protein
VTPRVRPENLDEFLSLKGEHGLIDAPVFRQVTPDLEGRVNLVAPSRAGETPLVPWGLLHLRPAAPGQQDGVFHVEADPLQV